MIIYNDKGITHIGDNVTEIVVSVNDEEFVAYFDTLIEKLKETFLQTRSYVEWEALLNHRLMKQFRLHNFRPMLHSMCKYTFLEHVTNSGQSLAFFDFTYRTTDGRPLCSVIEMGKPCEEEPAALISKVTPAKGVLCVLMMCTRHEQILRTNMQWMNKLVDDRIRQHIALQPDEAPKYFPEYVERTVYDH
jgi:hypothetical protein